MKLFSYSPKALLGIALEWSTGAQRHRLHCAYPATKMTQLKTNFHFGC